MCTAAPGARIQPMAQSMQAMAMRAAISRSAQPPPSLHQPHLQHVLGLGDEQAGQEGSQRQRQPWRGDGSAASARATSAALVSTRGHWAVRAVEHASFPAARARRAPQPPRTRAPASCVMKLVPSTTSSVVAAKISALARFEIFLYSGRMSARPATVMPTMAATALMAARPSACGTACARACARVQDSGQGQPSGEGGRRGGAVTGHAQCCGRLLCDGCAAG